MKASYKTNAMEFKDLPFQPNEYYKAEEISWKRVVEGTGDNAFSFEVDVQFSQLDMGRHLILIFIWVCVALISGIALGAWLNERKIDCSKDCQCLEAGPEPTRAMKSILRSIIKQPIKEKE